MIDVSYQSDGRKLYTVLHPVTSKLVISTTGVVIARRVEALLDIDPEYTVITHFVNGQLHAADVV